MAPSSRSQRAGLQLPVMRIQRNVKTHYKGPSSVQQDEAGVYMTCVLETLAETMLCKAYDRALARGSHLINSHDLEKTINETPEFKKLFPNVIFMCEQNKRKKRKVTPTEAAVESSEEDDEEDGTSNSA
jgi:histone H3/H4